MRIRRAVASVRSVKDPADEREPDAREARGRRHKSSFGSQLSLLKPGNCAALATTNAPPRKASSVPTP